MTESVNPLSKCPLFFFPEPSVTESLALPGGLSGVKPEPDSHCRYRRAFIQEAGGGGCLLRQDIQTPSTPTQFCLRPRLHPRAFLAKRREKWVIFPKTQWCGVCLSACLPATKASILIFLIPHSTWGRQSWTKELTQLTDLDACGQQSFGRCMYLKSLIKMQSATNSFSAGKSVELNKADLRNNLFLSLI